MADFMWRVLVITMLGLRIVARTYIFIIFFCVMLGLAVTLPLGMMIDTARKWARLSRR
jgi:hypothetical protein